MSRRRSPELEKVARPCGLATGSHNSGWKRGADREAPGKVSDRTLENQKGWGTVVQAERALASLHHERRVIPGKPSKPESKLRIRLIPCCSMMARCTATRADISRYPIRISFARSAE